MDRLSLRQIALPAIYITLVGVILVFAHSGLQGDHGLAALYKARKCERDLAVELAAIRGENDRLAGKVEGLGSGALDMDLLDERARRVLGLARTDELVVGLDVAGEADPALPVAGTTGAHCTARVAGS